MTSKDIEFALELNGVKREDIDYVLDFIDKYDINVEQIDDELNKLGYERIIENELNDSWEDDDDYAHIEKFPHRHKFAEDYD